MSLQSIRRFAVASTLVIAGAVSLAPKVSAQSADIQFNASLPAACSFTNVVAGSLGFGTADGQTFAVRLDSQAAGVAVNGGSAGVTATADIDCSAAAYLSVSKPVQIAGPSAANKNAIATVSNGTLNLDSSSGTPIALTAATHNLTLDMSAESDDGKPLAAGIYAYKVTLSATPQ